MILYLFIVGFISLLGQVVILRELTVAFYGIELIYILSIGFWLIGSAAGARMGKRDYIPSEKNILRIFIVFGILLLLDTVFIRSVQLVFAGAPGTYLSIAKQLTSILTAVFPLSLLLGLLFQWCAKYYAVLGNNLAKAYGIESLGGVLGGLSATFLMKWGFSNLILIGLCSGAAFLSAIIFYPQRRLKIKWAGYLLFGCLFLIFLINVDALDYRMTSWRYHGLVKTEDTPYARLAVTEFQGQMTVYENGALAGESESVAAEPFVHISMVQRESVHRVLVLGGVVEGIIKEILKWDIKRVDYVELNRELIPILQEHFSSAGFIPVTDDRLNIIYRDPREFLTRSKFSDPYDLIFISMPRPMSAGNNRFYTVEFFRECEKRLTKDGLVVFRMTSAENKWTPQQLFMLTSVYSALRSSFSDIVVLPGYSNIFMASSEYLDKKAEMIADRFQSNPPPTRLVSGPYIRYLYQNDRFVELNTLLQQGKTPVNSDQRPICYPVVMMEWLSMFFPEMAFFALYRDISAGLQVFMILFIGLFFLFIRYRKGWRNRVLAVVAGMAGMVVETMFLLNYQVHNGVLFMDIGLLLMSFMAGLSAGAFLVNRVAGRVNPHSSLFLMVGGGMLILFSIQAFVFYQWMIKTFITRFIGTWSMIFISGFLTAGIFSYASLRRVHNQKSIVSPLYAADLIGGAVGALIATLWMIPFLGMKISALAVSGFILAAILLL